MMSGLSGSALTLWAFWWFHDKFSEQTEDKHNTKISQSGSLKSETEVKRESLLFKICLPLGAREEMINWSVEKSIINCVRTPGSVHVKWKLSKQLIVQQAENYFAKCTSKQIEIAWLISEIINRQDRWLSRNPFRCNFVRSHAWCHIWQWAKLETVSEFAFMQIMRNFRTNVESNSYAMRC